MRRRQPTYVYYMENGYGETSMGIGHPSQRVGEGGVHRGYVPRYVPVGTVYTVSCATLTFDSKVNTHRGKPPIVQKH